MRKKGFGIVVSLIVVGFIAVVLGLTLFFIRGRVSFKPFAANLTTSVPVKGRVVYPEKDPNQFLYQAPRVVAVKFRQPLKLKNLSGKVIDWDNSEKVLSSQISPSSWSSPLVSLMSKYKVSSIKKVFKGAKSPNEDLVVFKNRFKTEITSGEQDLDEQLFLSTDLSRTYILSVDDSLKTQLISALLQNEEVEAAEVVGLSQMTATVNDPLLKDQWSIPITKTDKAWDMTMGKAKIKIAILDSGVDYDHPDLKNKMLANCDSGCPEGTGRDVVDIDTQAYINAGFILLPQEDYVTPDDLPMDYFGHGTHVAGIAAAQTNNRLGIAGVCPNCSVMPIRAGFAIDHSSAFGGRTTYGILEQDDIAAAIDYAVANGARIISMSFIGGSDELLVQPAIKRARASGVILVAAAGNNNSQDLSYPAAYPGVIAVTATDATDHKADFSNYGYWTTVAAPGVDIISTVPKIGPKGDASGYRKLSGTSMATPFISGVAGLIFSQNPKWKSAQVRQAIVEEADFPKETSSYIGWGRVNSRRAVQRTDPTNVSASIVSPQDDSFVHKNVLITGNAGGEKYSLLLGLGLYPDTFKPLTQGTFVTNGVLGTWPTGEIKTADLYTLKLIASNSKGTKEDYVRVKVDNALHPGWPQKVAVGGYDDLTFPFTPTLSDVDEDKISDIAIHSNVQDVVFKGDGTILPGWPTLTGGSTLQSVITSGQVPGLAVSRTGLVASPRRDYGEAHCFNLFDSHGQFKPGWPRDCGGGTALDMAFADLDGDGSDEVIALNKTDTYGAPEFYSGVNVFSQNGQQFLHWPAKLDTGDWLFSLGYSGLSVADIDHDGKKEVLFFSQKYENRNFNYYLWILNYDGTIRLGYPIKLDLNGDQLYTGIANVVDLNNDGKFEIPVVINQGDCSSGVGKVGYLDLQGKLLPGWSAGFSSYVVANALAVGDLDGDGKKETVFGTISCGLLDRGQVIALKNDGTLVFGWPQSTVGSTWSQITLADVDGDGKDDVLTTTDEGYVYGWKGNGKLIQGFPKRTYDRTVSGVAVGDVDGDHKSEMVVATAHGEIFVWNLPVFVAKSPGWPQYQHDAQHSGFGAP